MWLLIVHLSLLEWQLKVYMLSLTAMEQKTYIKGYDSPSSQSAWYEIAQRQYVS